MKLRTENLLLIASLVVCALLLSGFLPTRYGSSQPHTTKRIQYVVKAGETFWEIGERFYSENEIRPFDEFMHDFRVQNGFKVGEGRKFLQPNETLTIEIKEKI